MFLLVRLCGLRYSQNDNKICRICIHCCERILRICVTGSRILLLHLRSVPVQHYHVMGNIFGIRRNETFVESNCESHGHSIEGFTSNASVEKELYVIDGIFDHLPAQTSNSILKKIMLMLTKDNKCVVLFSKRPWLSNQAQRSFCVVGDNYTSIQYMAKSAMEGLSFWMGLISVINIGIILAIGLVT
ncbi:unnamed protein product, partial [Nesidiocoris tenuis]